MPAARLNFTDRSVKALPFTTDGSTQWISDATLPALQLNVGQKSKTYTVVGRVAGTQQQVRVKLGRADVISAPNARTRAKDLLDKMAQGIDPRPKVLRAQEASAGLPTLRELLDKTLSYRTSRGLTSDSTGKGYRRAFDNHLDEWLDQPINALRKSDVIDLHDRVGANGNPFMANHVLSMLGVLFSHATERLDLDIKDPTRGIDRFPEPRREGVADWKAWYAEVMALTNVQRRFTYRLGALTGLRRANICRMDWSMINFEAATITPGKLKNKATPTLPLSDEAVRLLRELFEMRTDNKRVFPSPTSASGYMYQPNDPGVSAPFHATRHMFSTAGMQCGIPKFLVKRLRGDLGGDGEAIDGYLHLTPHGLHGTVNTIAAHLLERWGVKAA